MATIQETTTTTTVLRLSGFTIHAIHSVQFTCLTFFLHNLFPSFLWSTSWPGTLPFICHTFIHIIIFFSQHMPNAHTITAFFAVVPRLCHLILVSLSTLYLELYFVA